MNEARATIEVLCFTIGFMAGTVTTAILFKFMFGDRR